MSNRRVKTLALDEDDYDDYDYDDDTYENAGAGGDDGLTAEDREQLRLGTIEVRKALPADSPATDSEIQEALWHYYYDVGKSVAYLNGKQKTQSNPAKKQTPASKSKPSNPYCVPALPAASPLVPDIRTDLANGRPKSACNEQFGMCSYSGPWSQPFSVKHFFDDCPWLRVPEHRKAEIVIERLYPRGGLPGGASKPAKMSKLAALAAKRRQEAERPSAQASSSVADDGYAESLKKLKISQAPRNEAVTTPTARTGSKEPASMDVDGPIVAKASAQVSQEPAAPPASEAPTTAKMDLRAHPSAFASILISPSADRVQPTSSIDLSSTGNFTKLFDFAEPSPDDIVTKAQNSKAPTATKPKAKDVSKSKTSVTNGVQELSIAEAPKIKSKGIDVIAEYKKIKRKNAANFVVIGHVDAGKSTLMGRLLFDLKAVDQRTMDKYKKEAERIGKGSFAFAWVLDQGSEERARGVTIDIATNNFETEKTSFTILDAPGHRDFVPNMIAGASQADFAVLVIDASTGNFESGLKGQTKEHALLVRSIGVQKIIVAVNKMDVAQWSEERFKEIQQQMSAFLTSAGFQPRNIAFVPCSGLEGGNILAKTTDPKASWYTGSTLIEELDRSEPSSHALDKPLRMTINDVFRGGVQNPLSVSGRLEAGNIQMGEQVIVMPSGETAFVRTLEVDEEPREWAVAGQNVTLHLTDVDPIHLKTGDVLCGLNSPIGNISEFKAKVLAFDHLTPMNVDMHKGRLHVPGRITQLVGTLDKSSGTVIKKKPKIVQPGSVVRVVVQLDAAVPLEAPARVVFRSNGETVAAGLIE